MPAEHRAVLLLLGLAVAGHGIRHFLTRPDDAPGDIQILAAGPPGSPGAHRDSVVRHAKPLAPGERIDADRAPAVELERLPGVGPGLARKIVADREARGAFGSLQGLDRVPGIGAALLGRLKDAVAFSGNGGSETNGSAPPGPTPPAIVNVNSAGPEELQRLPGIGPAKARAIVAYREAHGPFATLDSLLQVPGIGPSILIGINGLAETR